MGNVTVIAGPTATGKSSVAVSLAKITDAEIVSADSVQVYRYMDIGSAKVSEEEMDGVVHWLIDEFDPDEEFSVSIFQERADECIKDILKRGKNVIIAGGSGLYVDSLVYDAYSFDTNASADEEFRKSLYRVAEEKGKDELFRMLEEVDPESALEIHPNNVKRVIRAIEYHHLTGKKKSAAKGEKRKFRYDDTFYFCLEDDRKLLYKRIDRRVDKMFEDGLVDEVKSLLNMGYTADLVSMKALGYKETIAYLDGSISLDEAKYIIKRDTRRFAKRQLTWYRRNEDARWINIQNFKDADQIAGYIKGIEDE